MGIRIPDMSGNQIVEVCQAFKWLGLQMVERHFEFTIPNPGTYFGPGFENIQGCKLTICKPEVG